MPVRSFNRPQLPTSPATVGVIVLCENHVIDEKRFVVPESSLEAVKPSAAAIC
jgi:hypothetical protein